MEKRRGQVVIIGEDHTDLGIAMLDLMPPNGVDLLVQHLMEVGHAQIDCFNSEPHSNGELRRVQAWQEALAAPELTGNLIDHPATPGVDALVVAMMPPCSGSAMARAFPRRSIAPRPAPPWD